MRSGVRRLPLRPMRGRFGGGGRGPRVSELAKKSKNARVRFERHRDPPPLVGEVANPRCAPVRTKRGLVARGSRLRRRGGLKTLANVLALPPNELDSGQALLRNKTGLRAIFAGKA